MFVSENRSRCVYSLKPHKRCGAKESTNPVPSADGNRGRTGVYARVRVLGATNEAARIVSPGYATRCRASCYVPGTLKESSKTSCKAFALNHDILQATIADYTFLHARK